MIKDLPKGLLNTTHKTLYRNHLIENKAAEIVKQELKKAGKTLEQMTPEEKKALFDKVDRLVKSDDEVQEATKALGYPKDLKGTPRKDTDGAHDHNPVDHQAGIEQAEDEAKREKRSVNKSRHPLEDGDISDEVPHAMRSQATVATEEAAQPCAHHAQENCKKCNPAEEYKKPKKK